jgi:hypothetical protein
MLSVVMLSVVAPTTIFHIYRESTQGVLFTCKSIGSFTKKLAKSKELIDAFGLLNLITQLISLFILVFSFG